MSGQSYFLSGGWTLRLSALGRHQLDSLDVLCRMTICWEGQPPSRWCLITSTAAKLSKFFWQGLLSFTRCPAEHIELHVPGSGTGYSCTLPDIVICYMAVPWPLMLLKSCRFLKPFVEGWVFVERYGRCVLLKISHFLSTLASAKLLIQVLVSTLKSWFLQVNWNGSTGNPLNILNALKNVINCSSVTVFL